MKEKEVNNEQKIIATNKTNPVLMKIARREKWIKPFAKKLTAEDASRVTELRFQKLFVAFVPAKGDEEMLVDAGNGNYSAFFTIEYDDINMFDAEEIIDASGNVFRFSDDQEIHRPYTFGIWNTLPDATLEHFDEFEYFTGVTSIPPFAFYRFKNLKSIVLPPSIKKIGQHAFLGCISLESVKSELQLEDIVKLIKQ